MRHFKPKVLGKDTVSPGLQLNMKSRGKASAGISMKKDIATKEINAISYMVQPCKGKKCGYQSNLKQ